MSSDTLVATPDEPKRPSPSADECFEQAKRLLLLAELHAPGNPTAVEMHSSLAAEWRTLGAFIAGSGDSED